MNNQKAISNLAVFLLQNKTDVISLINRLRIASLPLNASIAKVNEVVIDNSTNKELEKGLMQIATEENEYKNAIFTLTATAAWIIGSLLVVTAGVAVQQDIRRNKKMRREIFRDGFRSRYLNKETRDEIAFLNRKEMQKQFLLAQSDYLQQEENLIQKNREKTRMNSLYIALAGGVVVYIAIKILKK